jgi:DNA-binding FadR family transcriptional regulator
VPLQTVEPQRLYRQIADQLRALIAKGEFAVGARLPAERDLAKQLGVSRPSVREALIALEVEGWVEVRTGSGVYVLDRSHRAAAPVAPTEWGPLELIRARRVIEGETAAIAAAAGKRKDVDAMTRAIEAMREMADRKVMPLEGDRAFHLAIVDASGNAVLVETVQNFWDSRKGPIFTRLGGYFENVAFVALGHRRARGHPRRGGRPRRRGRARRDARAHGQVAPEIQRELATREAFLIPRQHFLPFLPFSAFFSHYYNGDKPHDREQQEQQTHRPQGPGRLRPRGRRTGRPGHRLGADQAQVGPRLRDLGALPQVLGVGRRRDQEAHQRQVRHPGVPGLQLGKEADINQGLTLGTVDIILSGASFAGRTYTPLAISTFRSSSATPSTS